MTLEQTLKSGRDDKEHSRLDRFLHKSSWQWLVRKSTSSSERLATKGVLMFLLRSKLTSSRYGN